MKWTFYQFETSQIVLIFGNFPTPMILKTPKLAKLHCFMSFLGTKNFETRLKHYLSILWIELIIFYLFVVIASLHWFLCSLKYSTKKTKIVDDRGFTSSVWYWKIEIVIMYERNFLSIWNKSNCIHNILILCGFAAWDNDGRSCEPHPNKGSRMEMRSTLSDECPKVVEVHDSNTCESGKAKEGKLKEKWA